jgi:hypothetical protein
MFSLAIPRLAYLFKPFKLSIVGKIVIPRSFLTIPVSFPHYSPPTIFRPFSGHSPVRYSSIDSPLIPCRFPIRFPIDSLLIPHLFPVNPCFIPHQFPARFPSIPRSFPIDSPFIPCPFLGHSPLSL